MVLKVSPILRLSRRAQLRNAGTFKLSSQIPERDLRLDQASASVDRRQNLLLARLRFPHRDFITEAKLKGLAFPYQPFRSDHRYGRQYVEEGSAHVGPRQNFRVLVSLFCHRILASIKDALDYSECRHTASAAPQGGIPIVCLHKD
jgi:hypothetical protein